MVKEYKKYGVTTNGYRGQRAILTERVIEGFTEAKFTNLYLLLDAESPQTIYLNSNNTGNGCFIVLPDATTLWKNWRVTIINDSLYDIPVYYYTSSPSNSESLVLFKTFVSGNMGECILLDDSYQQGNWTVLKVYDDQSLNPALMTKYTSNVFDEKVILWNEFAHDSDEPTPTVQFSLGKVLAGTSLRSVYVKTTETFTEETDMTISIGTSANHTQFIANYELTNAVADNNFTKDYFEEILSTSADTEIYAFITGSNLDLLDSGAVKIVVEKAKLIDPTVLNNPIVQTQLPIGVILSYAFSVISEEIPEGFFRLDGSVFSNAATSIPKFVEKLNSTNNRLAAHNLIVTESEWQNTFNQYGSCGKFAWVGSGLRFPAINCFVQGLTSMDQLALLTPAGLPNITGGFRAQPDLNTAGDTGYGAFIQYNPNGKVDSGSSGNGWPTGFTFDASRSNSIYGRSNTVTPLNIRYPYIISVYNKVQTSSQLDIDALMECSVNKANITLDNINFSNVDAMTRAQFVDWGMPDYTRGIYSLNGTALSDGWLYFRNSSDRGGPDAYVYIDTTLRFTLTWIDSIMIPISKNQAYAINGGTNIVCHFYPCKGV